MSFETADDTVLRLSSGHLPERDRVTLWREVIARAVIGVHIEPLVDVPFHAEIAMRMVGGISVGSCLFGGIQCRTPELLTDGNNSLALLVNTVGPFVAGQRRSECVLGEGDGYFASFAETSSFVRPSAGRMVGLVIPRAALAPHVRAVDDAIGRMIPRDHAALKLLTSYVGALEETLPSASPEVRRAAASRLCDLVALTIGATPDAAFIAKHRGVSAARLAAIKADISKGLGRRDVSVAAVAARHRITPRHVHRLFETEGASFSEFVLCIRLANAHRMLSDPQFAQWSIKAIVHEIGFGDRSYFNRVFRRHYGASPSYLRAAIERGSGD